jgi:hypothetical protein
VAGATAERAQIKLNRSKVPNRTIVVPFRNVWRHIERRNNRRILDSTPMSAAPTLKRRKENLIFRGFATTTS